MTYFNDKFGYKIFSDVQFAQMSLPEAKKYFHSKNS